MKQEQKQVEELIQDELTVIGVDGNSFSTPIEAQIVETYSEDQIREFIYNNKYMSDVRKITICVLIPSIFKEDDQLTLLEFYLRLKEEANS